MLGPMRWFDSRGREKVEFDLICRLILAVSFVEFAEDGHKWAGAEAADVGGAVDADLVGHYLRAVGRASRRLTCWRKLGH